MTKTPHNLLLACLFLWVLTSCDEEPSQAKQFDQELPSYAVIKPVPQNLQDGMPADKSVEMLSVADPTPPEQWLFSRYVEETDNAPNRDKAYYKRLLTAIEAHVHEQPRVIANRTVQTTRQLLEMGIDAEEGQIMEDFSANLQNVSGRYVYGELCANYSNLRQQQLTHEQAIKALFDSL